MDAKRAGPEIKCGHRLYQAVFSFVQNLHIALSPTVSLFATTRWYNSVMEVTWINEWVKDNDVFLSHTLFEIAHEVVVLRKKQHTISFIVLGLGFWIHFDT